MRDVVERARQRLLKRKRSMSQKYPAVFKEDAYPEIDKMVLSGFVEERILPLVGSWPYPLDELLLMTGTVCLVRPTKIFEWGTYIGTSARIFYETCRRFSIDAEIHSIDLPDTVEHIEHPHKERGRLVRGLKGIVLHQGDGVSVAASLITDEDRRAGRILFFVDGDHEYASVKRELDTILQGDCWQAILVHDTFCQTEVSGYNTGPWRAVDEVLREANGIVRYETVLGLPGMTLLLPNGR